MRNVKDLLNYRQPCVQDLSVSPTPDVGGVSLLVKTLGAVTFIMFLCLTCDDVHYDCPPGGHTTEILRLMESLSAVYTPRHYVIADTDRMSEDKICTFEASRQSSKSQVDTTALTFLYSSRMGLWCQGTMTTFYACTFSTTVE